jgi:long-subunit fatty acid transport protein
MRNMNKALLLMILFSAFSFSLFAQSQVGNTASSFLEIPVGARSIGMGEAHVAAVSDVSALYWNPAGITRIDQNQVTFQNTDWFVDTKLYYAASVFKLNEKYLGISINMFDSGEMDVRTITLPDGTGEKFKVQDISIGLSYAQALTDNFSLGGSLKFVQNQVWRMTASTIALDLGFFYETPFKGLDLGFSISNFGGEMKLEGDNTFVPVDLDPLNSGNNDGVPANLQTNAWDLPLIFRIGTTYDVIHTVDHKFIISADAVYPNNNTNYINTGAEYAFRSILFLRSGYSNIFIDDDYGTGHFRAGIGLKPLSNLEIDFAISDRNELGYIQTIGLSIGF